MEPDEGAQGRVSSGCRAEGGRRKAERKMPKTYLVGEAELEKCLAKANLAKVELSEM